MRRVFLVLMLAVSCVLALGQAPAAGAAGGRFALGYYVPYSPSSWESLQAHADALDAVAAQWVTVDACGGLGSNDDQTLKQFANEHHVKVLASLLTGLGRAQPRSARRSGHARPGSPRTLSTTRSRKITLASTSTLKASTRTTATH